MLVKLTIRMEDMILAIKPFGETHPNVIRVLLATQKMAIAILYIHLLKTLMMEKIFVKNNMTLSY